jgi:sugar lactone lactonase YvrE
MVLGADLSRLKSEPPAADPLSRDGVDNGGSLVIGGMRRALRRGTLAGSLVFAVTGGVGLFDAAQALASTGYTISRYAGIGPAGGTTTGPALTSQLDFIVADALDPAGNLYIAAPFGGVVEKVTPDGILSIFAGKPGQNGPPVPGPAASSTLNIPGGVAADSAGNLYIADQNNNAIEKVTPDGNLSVFAGMPGHSGPPTPGSAISSHMNAPDGVATDSAGNVYVADYFNAVVEKITPGGQLSVIAGMPGSSGNPTQGPATSSHLSQADGVAVDSAGNVYIADGGADVIEKVTPGGTLSIFAGISGTSAPPTAGLATASALDNPNGVGVDAAGAVYVADTGANVIEKITSDGHLSVIAGNGSSGAPAYNGPATGTSLNQPLGMVVDPAGNVFVADSANHTIDRLTPPAPISTTGPAITGNVQASQTLSTDGGSWDNAPFTETYQWQDCDSSGAGCTAISGATSRSYTVAGADTGHTLRVVVTALNGGGSAVATSAATAVVSAGATVTATTTTAPAPMTTPAVGPLLVTTAPVGSGPGEPPVKPLAATLGGEVSPSDAPVTYHFQYGTNGSYGSATPSATLPASSTSQAVHANVRGLIPGTVYHYRLVATTPSGTSYGQDETLTTPRGKLRRVRDHITHYRDTQAPYRYRLHGWMVRPDGLTKSIACRSGGTATVTVTWGGKVLATRRMPVSPGCTYDSTIVFTAAQLPRHGRLFFHMSFAGNRQLLARHARTLKVLFG